MKDYQNTAKEWAEFFTALAEKTGEERLAVAVWTKHTVEHQIKQHGYRLEMSEDEWNEYAHNTEDAWSAFDEEDLMHTVSEFNLAREEE